MSMFHFNLSDGSSERDLNGTFFPDLHAAQLAAVVFAGAMAAERAESICADGSLQVELTDPDGLVLSLVTMIVTNSAAAPFIPLS